jgi:hypothetical protein
VIFIKFLWKKKKTLCVERKNNDREQTTELTRSLINEEVLVLLVLVNAEEVEGLLKNLHELSVLLHKINISRTCEATCMRIYDSRFVWKIQASVCWTRYLDWELRRNATRLESVDEHPLCRRDVGHDQQVRVALLLPEDLLQIFEEQVLTVRCHLDDECQFNISKSSINY